MSVYIFDLECTDLNPSAGEILTAHFIKCNHELEFISEKTFYFRPDVSENRWSKEAEAIHGITYKQAKKFPERRDSINHLSNYLGHDSWLFCYANYNNQDGKYLFDVAYLKNLYYREGLQDEYYRRVSYRGSVHTMYKELAKSALAPKLKTYTLANAASVYGIPLNNHDAKSDAHATYEILKKLNYAMKVNGENYRKYIEPVNNLRKIIDLEVIV